MTLSHRVHSRCACAASAPFAVPGTERKYERSRLFRIAHLFLDLTLDFGDKSVSGRAELEFERVASDAKELKLDAVGFEIQSVELETGRGRSSAAYEYDGEQLVILGLEQVPRGKLRIAYRALPRRGLYFLEPDAEVKDRPVQAWTQCQDEDARYWFPCHDKPHMKMTTELRVQVPHGFTVLSNGNLSESLTPSDPEQPWVYHFKLDQPHPSYLVTLVAGNFAIVEDRPAELADGRRVPVLYYVPPGREADGKRSFGETPRMIELFSKLTGVAYPWQRYSQIVVSDFIFGGMENTTATTMYEHVLLDERAALDITSNDLVAHELAHQWFGDYVTCRDWSHAWLNEGFATFFEHVERESRLGRDEYDYGVLGDIEAYLREADGRYSRAIVCRDYAEPIDLFDRHLYEKGGLVLHMLRRKLGDEVFWQGVREYLNGAAYAVSETNDLQRALERVSGLSLEGFFDQWVYRPGHPDLKVKVAWDDGLLSVSVQQTQKTGEVATFHFDLEIEVRTKNGALRRYKKEVTSAQDALVVELAERPRHVGFDPELRLATRVQLEAPQDMLRDQLRHGSNGFLRWSAAQALGKRDDPPTVTALSQSVEDTDEAWMVRAEAARALGKIRSAESLNKLVSYVTLEHPKVRRAVMDALGNFRKEAAAELLSRSARKDASYLVQAEALRALGRTRQPQAIHTLLEVIDQPSWSDVVRAGALGGLSALRDDNAVPPVLERTRYGISTRGRRAAVAALVDLSDSRKVREHLEDLLEDRDPYLKIEIVAAIESLGNSASRGPLRRALDRELDGRVQRRIREALRNLGDGGARDRKRQNDEIEGLKNELLELKSRLSKLEAKKGEASTKPAAAAASAGKAKSAAKATPARARSGKGSSARRPAPAARTGGDGRSRPGAKAPRKKRR